MSHQNYKRFGSLKIKNEKSCFLQFTTQLKKNEGQKPYVDFGFFMN